MYTHTHVCDSSMKKNRDIYVPSVLEAGVKINKNLKKKKKDVCKKGKKK